MRKLLRWVLALSTISILSGCNAPKSHLSKFNQFFEAADFEKARNFAQKKTTQKDTPRGEDLLWSLQIGSIDRIEGNYTQSTEMFDVCEDMMTHFDSENSGIGHAVGAVAVNENIVPYTGQVYDGVMVNTYKAMNFMSTGQYDLARVEFNRALDRQRRAKETFSKEIQKQKDEISADENSENVQKSLDNSEMQKRLEEVYPSLYNFSAYPDFVNPFATYMAGLFFLIEGDYSKSIDLLKESAATVWVIFENGLGPVKEEFRIDLPLFIFTDNVRYVGIALPKLMFRQAALPYLELKTDSTTSKTQLVADMDRVVQTEFEKDFKGILTRAIISTTAKAAAQYALENNSNSSWAAVAMAVYNFVSTAADVRIWTALPKDIQAARLVIPENGDLTLYGPTLTPIQVKIGNCNYAIVYVRMISTAHQPSIEIMTF
ncbi:MAG: COG3014 family protein [Planctomycetota bacterium]|jgi:hypothetical protein